MFIYYLTASLKWEFGSSLAGNWISDFLLRFWSRCRSQLQSSGGLLRARGFASQFNHLVFSRMLWSLISSTSLSFSLCELLPAWLFTPPQVLIQKRRKSYNVDNDLPSEVTCLLVRETNSDAFVGGDWLWESVNVKRLASSGGWLSQRNIKYITKLKFDTNTDVFLVFLI